MHIFHENVQLVYELKNLIHPLVTTVGLSFKIVRKILCNKENTMKGSQQYKTLLYLVYAFVSKSYDYKLASRHALLSLSM